MAAENFLKGHVLRQHIRILAPVIVGVKLLLSSFISHKAVVHPAHFLDLIDFIGAVGWLCRGMLRLIGCAVAHHQLGKLADMKGRSVNIHMGIVDVLTGNTPLAPVQIADDDIAMVGNFEKVVIKGVDKADFPISVRIGECHHAFD